LQLISGPDWRRTVFAKPETVFARTGQIRRRLEAL